MSGTVSENSGRLAVRAPGAITGTLTQGRNDRFTGVIGGQRVSFRVR